MMNVTSQIKGLALRAGVSAALACACLTSVVVHANEVPNRELSPASPGAHAQAAAPEAPTPSLQEQLKRLALEAAIVDSSAFGQLRLLRDVEAKLVDTTHSAGASEHCR
jgi:hypothetical protein